MNQNANQIKYGLIKAAHFIIDQGNHGEKKNDIEIFSTRNEEKSIIAERFIRTLKHITNTLLQYQKIYITIHIIKQLKSNLLV